MILRTIFLALFCIATGISSGLFFLEPLLAQSNIPEPLKPWVEWVKERHPEWRCAQVQGAAQCVWPAWAKFEIHKDRGSLSLKVEMLSAGRVELPYSAHFLPRDIKVINQQGLAVNTDLEFDADKLYLHLDQGNFQINTDFLWSEPISEIPVPENYGWVDVQLVGLAGDFKIKRTAKSVLIENRSAADLSDSLSITVFRKLKDGSPLELETRIRLRISGSARPVDLGQILPDGFVPVEAKSNLPFRITDDGKLALQLLSGEFEVGILAFAAQPISSFKLATPQDAFWPNEELLAWFSDGEFRSVELEGISALEANATNLPSEWQSGAAYLAKPGAVIKLKELRRGEQSRQSDQISLVRELWPNFLADGFTVKDTFAGKLYQKNRLNALPDTKLGRATKKTSTGDQSLLISMDPESKARGIELRDTEIKLEAISEIDGINSINAVGWDQSVSAMSMTLHLPPMWDLIYVSGARAVGSWVESWSLLHLFAGIVVIVAAKLLLGPKVAILLALALPLNHQEFLAPRMLILHILALTAWRSTLSVNHSFWRKLVQGLLVLTYTAWALQGLAFIKLELTQLLFPQLEAGTRHRTILQGLLLAIEDSLLVWPILLALLALTIIAIRYLLRATGVASFLLRTALVIIVAIITLPTLGRFIWSANSLFFGLAPAPSSTFFSDESISAGYEQSYSKSRELGLAESDGSARKSLENEFSYQGKTLLSGPAVPNWSWKKQQIQVSGPIDASHELRFVLLTPTIIRLLSALRALLIFALIIELFKRLGFKLTLKHNTLVKSGLAATLILICNLFYQTKLMAELPSPALLSELEERLAKQVCKRKECALIERADFQLLGRDLKISLNVSSNSISAISLPGPLQALQITALNINNQAASALRRVEGDFLEIRVPVGRSKIELRAVAPEADAFSLQFRDRPLVSTVNAAEWVVEGLSSSGALNSDLRFSRKQQQAQSSELSPQTSSVLPSWFVVKREIFVAESITLINTVERLGQIQSAARANLTLLSAERVTSGDLSIDGDKLALSFAPNQRSLSFKSSIPYSSVLEFKAASDHNVSEEWRISCSTLVSCSFSGLAPMHSNYHGRAVSVWRPFSGEKVNLALTALQGFSGEHLTVDSAKHVVNWGVGVLEANLTLGLRVTQVDSISVDLPEGAILGGVTLNAKSANHTFESNTVSLLLSPGEHKFELRYRQPSKPGLLQSAPALKLNTRAHNYRVQINPSNQRWLLWTSGEGWGPGVLFWSKMLIMIGLCFALRYTGILAISSISALFLGIGLATLPLIVFWAPLIWLVLLGLGAEGFSFLSAKARSLKIGIFVGSALLATTIFYQIVKIGLVLTPPMLVVGNRSSALNLNWFYDHVSSALPTPWIISLPFWCWRAFAIVWATWLVIIYVSWVKKSVNIVREIE